MYLVIQAAISRCLSFFPMLLTLDAKIDIQTFITYTFIHPAKQNTCKASMNTKFIKIIHSMLIYDTCDMTPDES